MGVSPPPVAGAMRRLGALGPSATPLRRRETIGPRAEVHGGRAEFKPLRTRLDLERHEVQEDLVHLAFQVENLDDTMRVATQHRGLIRGIKARMVSPALEILGMEMPRLARRAARESGIVSTGDLVVITAGTAVNIPGSTNVIKVDVA